MATWAILGHDGHGKTTLAKALSKQGAPFEVADPIDWTLAGQWSGAILVVSAPDGLMPGSRSNVITAVRSGLKKLVVFVSKTDAIDDADLLDLLTLEAKELIAKHGPPGEPPVVRGSASKALAGDAAASQAIAQLIAAVGAMK